MIKAGRGMLLVLAIAATSMVSAELVHAQPSATAPRAPRRAVTVEISGPPEETAVLAATIRELLARLQLTVVPRGRSDSTLLTTVDVTIDSTGTAHVMVRSAAEGTTVLSRDIPRDANAAIQREQIAHAVRGAAEAELLADEDRVAGRAPPAPVTAPAPALPATSEPAPPPPPPPPPPAPSPEPAPPAPAPPDRERTSRNNSLFALDVATFAGAGFVGSGAGPVGRVGGSLTVGTRRGLRPSLAVTALYAFPFTAGSDTVSTRTSLFAVRALPAIEVLRRAPFAAEVSAGGGIDAISVEPSSATLPVSAVADASTRIDPILSAGATGRLALASDVTLLVSLLVDADLTTRRYVFANRGQNMEILSPSTIRPTLLAGISFGAIGAPPNQEAR